MRGRLFHARLPSPYSLYTTLSTFVSGYNTSDLLRATLLVLITGMILYALLKCRGRHRALGFLLVAAMGQIVLLYGISHCGRQSLYVDRYVVGAAGLLLVAASAGIATIPSRSLRGGVMACVLGCCLLALGDVYTGRLPDAPRRHAGIIPPLNSPAIARALRNDAQPGTPVFHVNWETQPVLRWYAPEYQHRFVDSHGEFSRSLDSVCSRSYQAFYGLDVAVTARHAIDNCARLWLLLPEEPKALESLYAGILNTLAFYGKCHTAQRFSGERFLPAVLLGYTIPQAWPGNLPMRQAQLLVSSQAPGPCAVHLELRSTKGPGESEAWELAVENPSSEPQQLQCIALSSDASLLAMRMRPEGEPSKTWIARTYYANRERRPAMLCRIHPRDKPAQALEATVFLDAGEYAVFIGRTLRGPGYSSPVASLHASVAEQTLLADGATKVERGGWHWQDAGRCRIEKAGLYPVRVWARDPENHPEAFGVFSTMAFVRHPSSATQGPPHAEWGMTVPSRRRFVEAIPLATSGSILVLVGQGQRFAAVSSAASPLNAPSASTSPRTANVFCISPKGRGDAGESSWHASPQRRTK